MQHIYASFMQQRNVYFRIQPSSSELCIKKAFVRLGIAEWGLPLPLARQKLRDRDSCRARLQNTPVRCAAAFPCSTSLGAAESVTAGGDSFSCAQALPRAGWNVAVRKEHTSAI
ncbi:hypothetical protein NDU88_002521 [Pleurodeles waltl]|uniref:Uncharacterized protein n=1 Tax=Pleurodeles waltl TaxID=8319 RepID=A0AAV7VBF6_PLEWA|nr:hypothetical protein NDU88_002521 [Pleurodeles waltl]